MIARVARRVGRALAGVLPSVRRRRDDEAVLVVVPKGGVSAIRTAVLLGWPVEKTLKVLARLEAAGRLVVVWTENRRLFVKTGR